jgi:hypothetical protein
MTTLGVKCEVVADPGAGQSGRPGEDHRRDATKLVRRYRAGDLSAAWMPDEEHVALPDLVRAREVAKQDSATSAPPAEQISVAPRPTSARRDQGVVAEVSAIDQGQSAL